MAKYLYSIVDLGSDILGLYRGELPFARLGYVGEMCCPFAGCWSNSFPAHYNPDVLTTGDKIIVEQFEEPERAKQWIKDQYKVDPEKWFNSPAIDLVAKEDAEKAYNDKYNPPLDEMKKRMGFKEV